MSTKCSVDVQFTKGGLFCTTCNQYYEIYTSTHVCNPVLPCARPAEPTLIERYLKMSEVESITDCIAIECNECECARNALTAPVKTICPKCEYVGWFVVKSHGLCPACEAEAAPKPRRERKVKQTNDACMTESQLLIPRQIADLVLHLDYDSRDDCYIAMDITLVTYESVLSGECCVSKFARTTELADDQLYTELMQKLSDFMRDVNQKYEVRWVVASPFAKYRLIHLYEKYGTSDKSPLGLGF